MEFTGIPFVVVGSKVLDSHHDRERHLKQKEATKIDKHGCCYLFLLFILYNLFVK